MRKPATMRVMGRVGPPGSPGSDCTERYRFRCAIGLSTVGFDVIDISHERLQRTTIRYWPQADHWRSSATFENIIAMSSSLHIALLLSFVSCAGFALGEEECGDNYTCAICALTNGYGCAPISGGACVCCSAGQPKAACEAAGNGSHVLPTCPAGGATGEGCVRTKRLPSEEFPSGQQFRQRQSSGQEARHEQAFEEECGDNFTCAWCHQSAYGCAPISGGACVCCSAGQSEADCAAAGNGSHALPTCPAGGATGEGCVRADLPPSKRLSSEQQLRKEDSGAHKLRQGVFDEECGDGYMCVHIGAYGCAKEPITQHSQMVCCSTGQPKTDCDHTGVNGSASLPYCPAGGATGEGCVRKGHPLRHSSEKRNERIPVND